MDAAALPGQVRHERARKDQQERDVQRQDGATFSAAAAQQERQAGDGHHRPEGDEDRMVINRLRSRAGTVEPLDDRAGHHHHDGGRQGAVADNLQSSRLHRQKL